MSSPSTRFPQPPDGPSKAPGVGNWGKASHAFGFATVDFNYWYNGGEPLEDPGDGSWLVEGSGSIYTGASPNPDPDLGGSVGELDIASPALPGVITQALHPNASSPLVGLGSATLPGFAPLDHAGVARPTPPSIGAFEPAPP